MHLRYIVIPDRVKNKVLKSYAWREQELRSIADQRALIVVTEKDGPIKCRRRETKEWRQAFATTARTRIPYH